MIRGIKFLGICVRDQARAMEFYTGKLGLTVRQDAPFEGGQRWIELAFPGAETGIVLFTPQGQEDRIGTFVHTSFWTDDLDKAYAELQARGVGFTTPPTKQSWGSFAIFKDPDGNSFVLGTK